MTLVPPGSHPLDWRRIFIGDESPLFLVEVAVRTTIIFLFTLLLLRVLGKRGLTQLTLFEMTIIIGLGAAVGDPMFQADVPLFHSMVVIGVIVGLYRLFLALLRRNQAFEAFFSGKASLLVEDGVVHLEALERERFSQEELFEVLRVSGIKQLGEVKRAYLERPGKLSVFSFPPNEVRAGLAIVPPRDLVEDRAPQAAGPGSNACRCCGLVRDGAGACARCKRDDWAPATKDPLS